MFQFSHGTLPANFNVFSPVSEMCTSTRHNLPANPLFLPQQLEQIVEFLILGSVDLRLETKLMNLSSHLNLNLNDNLKLLITCSKPVLQICNLLDFSVFCCFVIVCMLYCGLCVLLRPYHYCH